MRKAPNRGRGVGEWAVGEHGEKQDRVQRLGSRLPQPAYDLIPLGVPFLGTTTCPNPDSLMTEKYWTTVLVKYTRRLYSYIIHPSIGNNVIAGCPTPQCLVSGTMRCSMHNKS